MKEKFVYVVICRYGDCRNGDGAHIVGVYQEEKIAKEKAKKHETTKNNYHFSWFNAQVEAWKLL